MVWPTSNNPSTVEIISIFLRLGFVGKADGDARSPEIGIAVRSAKSANSTMRNAGILKLKPTDNIKRRSTS